MRQMMKVLYITMALVLSCVVPTYSMSMQEYKILATMKCFVVLVKAAMVMAPI